MFARTEGRTELADMVRRVDISHMGYIDNFEGVSKSTSQVSVDSFIMM